MEWWNYAIAIVLGVALGIILNKQRNVKKEVIHIIVKEDFYNNMRKGQLVDLRKESEYNENKIKGAKNYKPNQVTSKYSKLRKDQSVYLYCNNGRLSKRIAKKMSKDGYTAIYVLDKGLNQ
jgi:rhodanese-related sulfurtransferase